MQLVSLRRLKIEPPHVWLVLRWFPVLEMYVQECRCCKINLVEAPAAFLWLMCILRREDVELASHISCLCLGGIDLSTEGAAWYFGQKQLRYGRKNQ